MAWKGKSFRRHFLPHQNSKYFFSLLRGNKLVIRFLSCHVFDVGPKVPTVTFAHAERQVRTCTQATPWTSSRRCCCPGPSFPTCGAWRQDWPATCTTPRDLTGPSWSQRAWGPGSRAYSAWTSRSTVQHMYNVLGTVNLVDKRDTLLPKKKILKNYYHVTPCFKEQCWQHLHSYIFFLGLLGPCWAFF